MNVNIFALKSVSAAPNLRYLLGGLEQAATRAGAEKIVIKGTFAKELFTGARAEALARQLGYTYEVLSNGTVRITKLITK